MSETSSTPCFYIRAGSDQSVRLHYVGPGFLLLRHEQEHFVPRKNCVKSIEDHFITAEPCFGRRKMRSIDRNTKVLHEHCTVQHQVVGNKGKDLIKYLKKLCPSGEQIEFERNQGLRVFQITMPAMTKHDIMSFYEKLSHRVNDQIIITEFIFQYLGLEWCIKRSNTRNSRLDRTLME